MVRPLDMPGLGSMNAKSRDSYYFGVVDAITPEQLGKWTNRDLNDLVGTRVKLNQVWDCVVPQIDAVPAGEEGVIVEYDDPGIIAVKMVKHFDDLNGEDWNNCIHMSIDGSAPGGALAMLILYFDPITEK